MKNIIETIKGMFGGKAADMVTSVSGATGDMASSMTAKVTDMVTDATSNFMNFDDINVSTLKGYAEKFGIMDMLPAAIKSKLADGTLSDEDLKSFIPEIKDMIMSKMGK
jgi:hypothetical protein